MRVQFIFIVLLAILTGQSTLNGQDAAVVPSIKGRALVKTEMRPVAFAVSKDERMLAVGYKSGFLDVYSLPEGKPLLRLKHGNFGCQQLSFSDDGKTLFCLSWNGLLSILKQVDVWRVVDGTPVFCSASRKVDDPVAKPIAGDLAPNGTMIVLGGMKGVYIIEVATQKRSHLLADLDVAIGWFSRDSSKLFVIAQSDKEVEPFIVTIDVATRKELTRRKCPENARIIGDLSLHRDGVVPIRDPDGTHRLDLATLTSTLLLKNTPALPDEREWECMTPSFRFLACAAEKGGYLFDVALAKSAATLDYSYTSPLLDVVMDSAVGELALSGDGSKAYGITDDRCVVVWSLDQLRNAKAKDLRPAK